MPAEDEIGEGAEGRDVAELIDRRLVVNVAIREVANELRRSHEAQDDASRRQHVHVDRALRILDAAEDAGVRVVPLPVNWNLRDLLAVLGRPHIWGRDPVADLHLVAARWDAINPIHVRELREDR